MFIYFLISDFHFGLPQIFEISDSGAFLKILGNHVYFDFMILMKSMNHNCMTKYLLTNLAPPTLSLSSRVLISCVYQLFPSLPHECKC